MSQTNINEFNPYLHGLFAPVEKQVAADNLDVIGEIPRDLHGGYFRNGPNPKTPPKGMHHWFDGDGMIHGIWFEDGKARYANRYVATEDFRTNGAGSLGGIFEPSKDAAGRTVHYRDTANTDIVYHCWRFGIFPASLSPLTHRHWRRSAPRHLAGNCRTIYQRIQRSIPKLANSSSSTTRFTSQKCGQERFPPPES